MIGAATDMLDAIATVDRAFVCLRASALVLADPDRRASPAEILEFIRSERRARVRIFGDIAREDTAWNILLELADASRCQRTTTVSGACYMSFAPSATALRHIRRLVYEGLIERSPVARGDQRLKLLRISPLGEERLEQHLKSLAALRPRL